MKTKIALAVILGSTRGRVIVRSILPRLAPIIIADSSKSGLAASKAP